MPAEAQAWYDRRRAVSEAVVTRAASARAADARNAAAAAATAFVTWSETPPASRVALLDRAAGIMTERAGEIVAIAADELGAAADWVQFNVRIAARMLRQTADLAAALQAEEQVTDAGILRRRPAGVILGIAPWNAAVTLGTRAVAAPLACGNTVVLKGSELCPKTHEWIADVINSAGLPDGVLNYITNAPDHAEEVVEALVAHPAVRRVNFTGSTRVGREIAVRAARHLKPCLLELSGKGTMIVLADADIDLAATAAAHGSFFNQGQICMSTERVIVDESVADRFVARLRAETNDLRGGAAGPAPLGALVSPSAAVRLRAMIDDALAKGAEIVVGGDFSGGGLQPTVLDRIAPGMRLYDEEAFGPVCGIIRVGDREEALAIANDTDFGLVASVFSRDETGALDLLRQIETGIGHVNGSTVFDDPGMPFGGVKASGYGRFGGVEALREFTDCQWIAIHDSAGAAAPRPTPSTEREEIQ
ncbi:aldehyde dehydrogenase family protein [Psychromarinibacter sp. C21-152]|uniref:Aldehyde dehydrogenase family protein n=1 Tax=Psychromarinibacter sediminicola TaxID=3033385 RepID=A0AAE3TA35_9RHOB|nr:aldehyde dehydrogenase family protein [Psychromarinibacter sediminicola]MDF0602857.1 aldehyde dehydrogenase family protein [Psychromarinibacter sediminicola]